MLNSKGPSIGFLAEYRNEQEANQNIHHYILLFVCDLVNMSASVRGPSLEGHMLLILPVINCGMWSQMPLIDQLPPHQHHSFYLVYEVKHVFLYKYFLDQ